MTRNGLASQHSLGFTPLGKGSVLSGSSNGEINKGMRLSDWRGGEGIGNNWKNGHGKQIDKRVLQIWPNRSQVLKEKKKSGSMSSNPTHNDVIL